MTEERALELLTRAWSHALMLPALEAGDTPRAQAVDAWFAKVKPKVVRALARAALAVEVAPPGATLTPSDLRAVEAHFKDVLDLKDPGAKARAVLRPTWPETLAQLRAQIEQATVHPGPTVKNPAPLILADKAVQRAHRSYAAAPALYHLRGVSPDTQADYDAVDGIAWRLSAPEGFPPIPRRGGVYSPDEARAIQRRLQRSWELTREVERIGAAKDRERAEAGIPAGNVQRLLGHGWDTLKDWLTERTIGRQGSSSIPSAEGLSPRDFHAAVLAWGKDRVLPAVEALQETDPALFAPWPDPDVHVAALNASPVTHYAIANAAEYLYGLPRHTVDWSAFLGPEARSIRPNERVLVSGEDWRTKHWPLSQLIAAHRASDAAYNALRAKQEAGQKADLAAARPVLRRMLARGLQFSKVNVERVLPGYTFHTWKGTKHYTVQFSGPSGQTIASGAGATIGAALSQIEAALKLGAGATAGPA